MLLLQESRSCWSPAEGVCYPGRSEAPTSWRETRDRSLRTERRPGTSSWTTSGRQRTERNPRPLIEDRETTREKFLKKFTKVKDLALERSEYKVGKSVDNVVRQFKRR